MAKRAHIDFDGPSAPDPSPESTPCLIPAVDAPATAHERSDAVICQRCRVACVPVGPRVRHWVKCPTCGWKYKNLRPLDALRAARRAQQDRAAR